MVVAKELKQSLVCGKDKNFMGDGNKDDLEMMHARKQDVQNLHLQLEALTASNQILQARLLLREKSVATTICYMDVKKSWWVESLFNCSLARQKPELQLEKGSALLWNWTFMKSSYPEFLLLLLLLLLLDQILWKGFSEL
jgi:hypothetical protein